MFQRIGWQGALCVVLVVSGCARQLRPELGSDRTVEAGEPVSFGAQGEEAPLVTWRFGDDAKPVEAKQVSHAFSRSGTYTVEAASKEGEVLGSVQVQVVPRPVLKAVPLASEFVVFVPKLRANLPPVLQFANTATGGGLYEELGAVPLTEMLAQELEGKGRGMFDLDEGLAVFTAPGMDGTAMTVGVTEEAAALNAMVDGLKSAGARSIQKEANGLVLVTLEEDAIGLFVDRGYLYLLIPDATPESPPTDPSPEANIVRVHQLLTAPGASYAEEPLVPMLREKMGEGQLFVFGRPPRTEEGVQIRATFGALRISEGARSAELNGILFADKPLYSVEGAPKVSLFERAPSGPVAAASISLPPSMLAELFSGMIESWDKYGITEQDAKSFQEALKGDLALLLYFDPVSFFRTFVLEKKPIPRGTVLLQAGITNPKVVIDVLSRVLKDSSLQLEQSSSKSGTVFKGRVMDQSTELAISGDRLEFRAGEPSTGAADGNLSSALRERTSKEAFTTGHVSALIDVARLREQVDLPVVVPGVPPNQVTAARAFASALLSQITPVQKVWVDLAPSEDGARFRIGATVAPLSEPPSAPPGRESVGR